MTTCRRRASRTRRRPTFEWLRMKIARLVFTAILPFVVAACGTTRSSAPVVDRTTGIKTAETPKTPRAADARGYYTVKRGDTLLQIALEFGQNYRDLVAWNGLADPNDIKVDQVLRVLPPEGTAQPGSVTAGSGIETRPQTQPPPAAPATTNKTGPRGEKRPYSDATLAEMQKSETGTAAAPAPAPKSEPAKPTESKSAEKAPDNGAAPDDEGVSWVWPAEGKVVSNFSPSKKGIDIAGKLGQPVVAAGAGKVLYAGSGIRGYGNLVIVKHTNNLLSAYAHNKTIFVKEDQTVTKGQKIAEMGNSDTDSVKLHFEIRHQGKPVDPARYLPPR